MASSPVGPRVPLSRAIHSSLQLVVLWTLIGVCLCHPASTAFADEFALYQAKVIACSPDDGGEEQYCTFVSTISGRVQHGQFDGVEVSWNAYSTSGRCTPVITPVLETLEVDFQPERPTRIDNTYLDLPGLAWRAATGEWRRPTGAMGNSLVGPRGFIITEVCYRVLVKCEIAIACRSGNVVGQDQELWELSTDLRAAGDQVIVVGPSTSPELKTLYVAERNH